MNEKHSWTMLKANLPLERERQSLDNEEEKVVDEQPTTNEEVTADETVIEEEKPHTSFEGIFKLFLNSIDSYEIAAIAQNDDGELDEVLQGFLSNALGGFVNYIVKDLLDVDYEKGQFNVELTRYEEIMLAKAMKLEWVRNKKYSEELMVKAIGDRDYAAQQGYKYLEQLQSMEDKLNKEIQIMVQRVEFGNPDVLGDMA